MLEGIYLKSGIIDSRVTGKILLTTCESQRKRTFNITERIELCSMKRRKVFGLRVTVSRINHEMGRS